MSVEATLVWVWMQRWHGCGCNIGMVVDATLAWLLGQRGKGMGGEVGMQR
jgi:hypothetical protein